MCSFLEKVLVIVMDTIVSEYSYRLSLATIAILLQSCMAPKIFVAKSSTCHGIFTGSGNVLRGSLQSFVLTDIQSTRDLESLREKILILSDTMRPVSVLRIVCYY